MFRLICAAFLILFTIVSNSSGAPQTTIPTEDKEGSKDNPILKRYEGSYIIGYVYEAFDEFTFPLSALEPVKDKKDNHNNQYYEPKEKKTLEGPYTRLVYLIPEGRSPLEVLRNYQEEVKSKGGQVLYECEGGGCGGDPNRSSYGGGGKMSLSMYLFPLDRITEPRFSAGECAMTDRIADQRYAVMELPESGAHVSVLTYTFNAGTGCQPLNERTIAIVDIVESKAREQKMVTVKAEQMAEQISTTGSIALYGIYFDFNKADIKPESEPTLEQIAKLLNDSSALKLLVVGHTDNVGSFSFNQDLSQRRADAVVAALVSKYGIDKNRLMPVGVSFAAPVASNETEEGRAKNRRVELVKN
jgi:outer membrane protein OmpA-like peptidoglycan-associated protein